MEIPRAAIAQLGLLQNLGDMKNIEFCDNLNLRGQFNSEMSGQTSWHHHEIF